MCLPLSDAVIRIASPEVAAAKLGWPLADVLERREALGLPNADQRQTPRVARQRRSGNQHKSWSADEIALLSEFGPKEVAKRTGRSLRAVTSMKVKLFHRGVKFPDLRCARQRQKLGRSVWKPPDDALLGKMPDAEIARRLNISSSAVTNRRKSLGIPRYRPPRPPKVIKRVHPTPWNATLDKIVMALPTDEAVKATGRTWAAVMYRRWHLRSLGHKVGRASHNKRAKG